MPHIDNMELPKAPRTITRRNSRGLLEVVCAHTGRILCLQVSETDLFGHKWQRLVKVDTPDGPVYLERGLNFDLLKKCEPMPYSEVLAGLILNEVSNGKSIISACKQLNIEYATVRHWLKRNPSFSEDLEKAELDRVEYVKELIYEQGESGHLDALKWMAEKGNPDKYGPRMKHSGDKDSPVSFIIDTGIRREGDAGFERDVTGVDDAAVSSNSVGVENGLRVDGKGGGEAPSSSTELEGDDEISKY